MNKGLYFKNRFLGTLGEKTGKYAAFNTGGYDEKVELCVGDVISFYEYGRIYTKVVVKHSRKDEYGVFGFGSDSLEFENIIRILTYKDLTEDIFQKLQENHNSSARPSYKIKDIEFKEMTLDEIEKVLGYQVKIIKEKKGLLK